MNRTVSQCPQQHTYAHTPSPPVSINQRTTNKRNPDAAALSGPRMADTMASDTEPSALPNAEQSAVVLEAEVSSSTPRYPPSRTYPSSCENSAPSDPSTRTTSTETTNKPQPPTKTVESVRRKVVDVVMEAGPRVVSGVWLFYRKFDKPVNKKGQSTQCQVKASPESEICGRLYKHQSGTGTAPLLDHLKHHHPEDYKSEPRTKMLGDNICGGADCRKRAEQALEKITDKLQEQIAEGEPVAAPETTSSTEPPPKRRAVAGNAYERRQRRLEEEAASAV